MTAEVATKKSPRQVLNDRIKEQQREESRIVKGRFQCFQPVGGSVSFSFKKYKDDPVTTYNMKDGEIYEIPLSVARHLNQNCKYPINTLAMNDNGTQRVDAGRWVSRVSFTPLEFDAQSEIITEKKALDVPKGF